MTDDDKATRQHSELTERVERGDFDAALRATTPEEALLLGPERYFVLVAEIARTQFDPAERWDDFVRALWEQVDAGFGLTTDNEDESVRPWFDHPDDPSFVAWDQREGDG